MTLPLLVIFIALSIIIVTYMTLFYGIARLTNRVDVVDSAWGLGFVLVAWTSVLITQNYSAVILISAGLASIWGLRLFAHIARRNWRKHEDDHRYQELSKKWGKQANRKAYTNVFLLQGGLVLLVGAPLVAIATSEASVVNPGVWVGWAIWLGSIIFEAVSDYQLAQFIKHRPKGSHAIMTTGLWRFSRHPNYFGEVAAWWGAAIVAISLGQWWGIIGALTITYLITKVSGIPPLERHYADNADYQAYAKKTSVLVPLPPKA